MKNTPCKNCEKRYKACWGSCEDYKAWRKDFETDRDNIKEERDKYLAKLHARTKKRRKTT